MRISVLSGKGGTGKTFISVNLAYAARDALYIDCDVEAPNGRIFLKPSLQRSEHVKVMLPKINNCMCDGCKICVDFCKFNALAYANDKLLLFQELCHSCGGCILLCPQKALSESNRVIGSIQYGKSGPVNTRTGILNIGEAVGIPIIEELLTNLPEEKLVVVDCPPGSSCAVMESIKDSDFCVLVAEPTLFGIQNLSMVHELVKLFEKPYGVVINKALEGENIAKEYCKKSGIPILSKIPFDADIGRLNSQGQLVAEREDYLGLFKDLLERIRGEMGNETASNPQR